MGRYKKKSWYSREKLHEVIFGFDTTAGKTYDIILLVVIFLSVILAIWESMPRPSHTTKMVLAISEYVITFLFTIEYAVRVYCTPKPKKKYIFSFFGIVDMLSTLPLYLSFLLPGARYLVIIRAFRLIRVFRIFRLFTFLNEGIIFIQSLRRSFRKILVYLLFVLILVTIIGTLEYVIEHDQDSGFTDLPSSIYWAIVTMTTVGYGDITPVTTVGRMLSALVMVLGYTIIAVPTGIVSATVIDETRKRVKDGKCPRCHGKVEPGFKYCPHCAEKL